MCGIRERRMAGQAGHNFWLTAVGGFVLGALTVLIVLALAKRTGDRDEPRRPERPQRPAMEASP